MSESCRVYWGSHGCMLERGHAGDCLCSCSVREDGSLIPHMDSPEGRLIDATDEGGNVGRAPYYGPDTRFYGEDAEVRGLMLAESMN